MVKRFLCLYKTSICICLEAQGFSIFFVYSIKINSTDQPHLSTDIFHDIISNVYNDGQTIYWSFILELSSNRT